MKFRSILIDTSNPLTRKTMWRREKFGSFFIGWLIHWGSLFDAVIGIITFRIVLTNFGLRLAIRYCKVKASSKEE